MSLAGRYLAGVGAVAAACAGLAAAVPAGVRGEVLWGAVTGLVLQAPLGWWALRALGTERFVLTWGLGMLLRLTTVALAGLAVIPALGLSAGPMLGTMVGVLVALLLVEGATAVRHTREDER